METILQQPLGAHKTKLNCSVCDKEFRWKSGLSRHMKIFHTTSANYKCNVCKKSFQKQTGLRIHLRRHKTVNVEKLNSTKKILYSSDSDCEYELIATLSKMDPSTSSHECDECKKKFVLLSNLTKHVSKYHKNKHDTGVLVRMNRQKSRTPNPIIKFKNKYYFTIRKKKKFLKCSTEEESAQSPKYFCVICGKAYNRPGCLSIHMQTHNDVRPFLCSECGKSFTIKKYLLIHQRTHTQQRPYKCQHCGKDFIQKGNLVEHLRVHSGLRPYNCEVCGKRFSHSSGLNQHLLVHNPIKRHACKICGKRFRLPAHYREHIRVHSGDKPFSCNVCTRAFTNSSSLIVHLRTHSGERPFKCNVCKKGFIKSYGLKQHKKTHSACNILDAVSSIYN